MRSIFGKSVQGASHKIIDVECQDSMKQLQMDDGTVILAVADGHGSKSSPFSGSGSQIAVNVFCDVMSRFYEAYKDNLELFLTYLNREGEIKIGQAVDVEWKKRVLKAHTRYKREVALTSDGNKDEEGIYRQYGTTIVGLMITSIFIFAFRIGDGEVTFVDDDGAEQILVQERILGTETYSLSKIDSWKRAISEVHRRDVSKQHPSMFMLSTDGFYNSHKSEDEFYKTCTDYFSIIKQHGPQIVSKNLKDWLAETSAHGCGDDITLLIAFYFAEDFSGLESISFDESYVG